MVDNENYYCVCRLPGDLPAADQLASQHYRAAVLKSAKWQPGSSISIRFLDGDASLRARVKSIAEEWLQVANLQFEFRQSGPADIRIAFTSGNGSWSYLGTICRQIPEPKETMNYGWLTPDSAYAEVRRVVLHEFGHAIGLIHEHQNPKGGIVWNKPAVIRDLGGPPNNWSEATIENNMFHHYADVDATDVDSTSIMMYPIPLAWTLNKFSAGLNGELSPNDKVLVRAAYPR